MVAAVTRVKAQTQAFAVPQVTGGAVISAVARASSMSKMTAAPTVKAGGSGTGNVTFTITGTASFVISH